MSEDSESDELKIARYLKRHRVKVLPTQSAESDHWHPTATGESTPEYFESRAPTKPEASCEARLARAKIATMLGDLFSKPAKVPHGEREKLRGDAARWFFGDSDLEAWCDAAGYDVDWLRKRLREIEREGYKWRAEAGAGKRYEERRAYRRKMKAKGIRL